MCDITLFILITSRFSKEVSDNTIGMCESATHAKIVIIMLINLKGNRLKRSSLPAIPYCLNFYPHFC